DEELSMEGYEDEVSLEEDEEPLGAIFPLETFVVNLTEGGYLRCQVQLEFETRDIPKRFYVRQVPIRDAILGLFSARTKKDLSKEDGRRQIKKDIRELINEILRRQEVRHVYFTQFVVQ
ncbi:flagellar basal body-associated FliL family protein, partial [Oligoflexia bacterium]|nr:flagellar basal body-associated FliL family protein [Oligoflexia bacterium]